MSRAVFLLIFLLVPLAEVFSPGSTWPPNLYHCSVEQLWAWLFGALELTAGPGLCAATNTVLPSVTVTLPMCRDNLASELSICCAKVFLLSDINRFS